MKWVNISDELIDILQPYTDWFFSQDLTELEKHIDGKRAGDETIDTACEKEYLDMIVAKDGAHGGYPEHTKSIDILMDERTPREHREKCQELNRELCAYLGARNQAVQVYYPKDGFMGWHNNWNASGYNILLSYSPTGNGFFKYLDPKTKELVTMKDKAGWACKVGYYGRGREPDKVYYHCAGSYEDRLTLGFVIPHLELWRNMIEDISGEDATSYQ
jgi:hypothetical protein